MGNQWKGMNVIMMDKFEKKITYKRGKNPTMAKAHSYQRNVFPNPKIIFRLKTISSSAQDMHNISFRPRIPFRIQKKKNLSLRSLCLFSQICLYRSFLTSEQQSQHFKTESQ